MNLTALVQSASDGTWLYVVAIGLIAALSFVAATFSRD